MVQSSNDNINSNFQTPSDPPPHTKSFFGRHLFIFWTILTKLVSNCSGDKLHPIRLEQIELKHHHFIAHIYVVIVRKLSIYPDKWTAPLSMLPYILAVARNYLLIAFIDVILWFQWPSDRVA